MKPDPAPKTFWRPSRGRGWPLLVSGSPPSSAAAAAAVSVTAMLTTAGTTFLAMARKLGKPFCAEAWGTGAQPARTARRRSGRRGRNSPLGSLLEGSDAGFMTQFIPLLLT